MVRMAGQHLMARESMRTGCEPGSRAFGFGGRRQEYGEGLCLLFRPFNRSLKVGMPKQFSREPLLRELYERDLKTGGAGEFQGRQTVGVSGDQDNSLYRPVGGIGGDVEADSHIDAFLLELGLEVAIG